MDYSKAKSFFVKKLNLELPSNLYYHGFHHTMDVLNATKLIIEFENIKGEDETLLKTAALLHDSGFLKGAHEHEKHGCELASELLPQFGYNTQQIDLINGMIMATKVPQQPQNHLEEIICDADLDYLGRDDFEYIATSLFRELKENSVVDTEENWNRIQVKFLSAHRYFTSYSNRLREPEKQKHLKTLEDLVNSYDS